MPSNSNPPITYDWQPRTRHFLDMLMDWPSESGSDGERDFAGKLEKELRQWPYFAAHPERLWRQEAWAGGGENLFAFVRGTGDELVMLTGHFDTVTTANYGTLQPLATKPEALREALITELEAAAERQPALRLALSDLRGGDFLPGRGALDMKSGLAGALSVLERWLERPEEERQGNLLLVFSPDEEDNSRGARAARGEIAQLLKRERLRAVAGINMDVTSDQSEGGGAGRAIYLGTVGKLLPCVMLVGAGTHAGFPFEGISAHSLHAELLRRLELNPELADEAHGETAPPPLCLEARDFRRKYDVTTPERVWSAYNLLSHRRTPQQVLELICTEAQAAIQDVLDSQNRAAEALGYPTVQATPQVITVGELRAEVLGQSPQLRAQYGALLEGLEGEANPLKASLEVLNWLLDHSTRHGPLAIVGFGSLHYPAAHLSEQGAAGARAQAAAETLAQEHGLSVRQYFAGISDMSFMGAAPRGGMEAAAEHLAAPTPTFYDAPETSHPVYPTVNLGPWGRDYHQRYERVHMPYAMQGVPAAVWRLLELLLER